MSKNYNDLSYQHFIALVVLSEEQLLNYFSDVNVENYYQEEENNETI